MIVLPNSYGTLTRGSEAHDMPLESQRSQYRQLADILRIAIEAMEFPPGGKLPSEDILARKYKVSRPTVNQAIKILRAEGLVKVTRGKGAVVTGIPVIRRNAMARYQKHSRERGQARGAFDSEIRSLGLVPRSDLALSRIPAPLDISTALQIPAGSYVIVRKRHMFANDVPIQLAPSYIPADIADGTALAEHDSGPGGIVSRFKDLGFQQVHISETIKVRRATDEERQFLELEEDQAVTEIFHVGYAASGRAVEVCVHSIPSDRWLLEYEWDIH